MFVLMQLATRSVLRARNRSLCAHDRQAIVMMMILMFSPPPAAEKKGDGCVVTRQHQGREMRCR